MTTLIDAYRYNDHVAEAAEPIGARESIRDDRSPGSLVPRPRPLLLGGCVDIAATIRHRRRERRRASRLLSAA